MISGVSLENMHFQGADERSGIRAKRTGEQFHFGVKFQVHYQFLDVVRGKRTLVTDVVNFLILHLLDNSTRTTMVKEDTITLFTLNMTMYAFYKYIWKKKYYVFSIKRKNR